MAQSGGTERNGISIVMPAAADSLVDREQEFQQLLKLLDPAAAARCWLISGEPGIGKTELMREFCAAAKQAGALVLMARCSEDEGAPPWWPWTQVLRSLPQDVLSDEDVAALELMLEPRNAELEGRSSMLDSHLADRERFARFDRLSRLFQDLSADRTVLIAIDDLHWSEELSLRLFEHLVRNGGRVRLVGTYRDTSVSRRRPLGRLLNRIAADPAVERMRLSGLSADGTRALMDSIGGFTLSGELVASIHSQTGGNPYFVTELTRFLDEGGYFRPGVVQTPVAVRIPEGVRDVIGQRLDRLSSSSNTMLEAAGVIGFAFDEPVIVRMLDDLEPADVAATLDEALDARVIVETADRPGSFEFVHALMREAIFDDIGRAHRMRLHAKAAEALESTTGASHTRLAALATHWLESRLPDGPSRAALHLTRAADQAAAALAYEDAARYFEQALECLAITGETLPAAEGELQLKLGEVCRRSGAVNSALRAFERVGGIADELGDADMFAQAALGYESARWRSGLPASGSRIRLETALEGIAPTPTPLRVQLLASLARARSYGVGDTGCAPLAVESIEAARSLGDEKLLIDAMGAAYLASRRDPTQAAYRLDTTREQLALATRLGDDTRTADAYSVWTVELLESMELEEFDRAMAAFEIVANRQRQPHHLYQVGFAQAMRALLDGRYGELVALARKARDIGSRIDGANADGVYSMQMFTYFRDTGQLPKVAPLLEQLAAHDPSTVWAPGNAMLNLELGDLDRAAAEFERFAKHDFARVPLDELWLISMAYAAEICTQLKDANRADKLFRFLEPYRGRLLVFGPCVLCAGPIDRYLGMLLGTVGARHEATRFFQSAVDQSRSIEALPWLARSLLDAALCGCSIDGDGREETIQAASDVARRIGLHSVIQSCESGRDGTRLGIGIEALTRREREVLGLLAEGNSNRQIADTLCISQATVATHVRNLLGKTGARNRTEVAALALRSGLSRPDSHRR